MVKTILTRQAIEAMEDITKTKLAAADMRVIDDDEIEVELTPFTYRRLKKIVQPDETLSGCIVRMAAFMKRKQLQ